MKITDLEVLNLQNRTLLVRLRTDESLVGYGEASPMNNLVVAAHLLHSVKPLVLGHDPFAIEALDEKVLTTTYKIAGQTQAIALSGVEIACYDLIGKALNLPIYQLLGGAYRKAIPLYASSMRRDISPEEEAKRLKDLVDERGYRAVKIRIGDRYGHDADAARGRSEAVVRAVRKTLGDGVQILVDANSAFSPSRAIEIGRRLEPYRIFHYEEPCPYTDLEATKQVADALDMPVAWGEQDWDLRQFRRALEMRAADILQPDVIKAGGFLAMKKVAALCESHSVVMTPHCAQPNLGEVANLHFAAATPCCRTFQESSIEPHPLRNQLFDPPLVVKEGYLPVPEGPGLGVTIREDYIENLRI